MCFCASSSPSLIISVLSVCNELILSRNKLQNEKNFHFYLCLLAYCCALWLFLYTFCTRPFCSAILETLWAASSVLIKKKMTLDFVFAWESCCCCCRCLFSFVLFDWLMACAQHRNWFILRWTLLLLLLCLFILGNCSGSEEFLINFLIAPKWRLQMLSFYETQICDSFHCSHTNPWRNHANSPKCSQKEI